MAKIELNNLSSGYNINTINVNFGKIETEFKDKVVYRNEVSPMARDLDVNGFGVINLRNPVSNGDAVSYGFLLNSDAFSFTGLEYKGLWTPTTAYTKNNYVTVAGSVYIAQEAHTSSTDFITDAGTGKWVIFSTGGGDLLSTNNLSDLTSPSNARTNLNVPSRTGENASGSWNINAVTATLATLATNATLAANSSLIGGVAEPQLVKQTTSIGSAVLPVGTTAERDVSPSVGFFRYNQTLNSFEGYSGASWVSFLPTSAATTTTPGVVELATDSEAQAGTDSTRAVTPDNLGATVLGIGQTWQDLTASRVINTNYTNSTGRTIVVAVRFSVTLSTLAGLRVSGLDIQSVQGGDPGATAGSLTIIVPPGETYSARQLAGAPTITHWFELR